MTERAYGDERARINDKPEIADDDQIRTDVDAMQTELEHPSLLKLLAHYEEACEKAGGLPPRTAMSPALLKDHLLHLMWMEIQGGDITDPRSLTAENYYFRVFGSALAELYGWEASGGTMADGPYPNRIRESTVIHNYVVEKAKPMRVAGPLFIRDGAEVYVEALFLPFLDAGGEPRFMLSEIRDITRQTRRKFRS
ncbi:PAS domain-containing protein [Gimibacter soli]|uniref:PAS domain-containing protein n=1 Tax=Gimibacter soli TaxID=3024400 RepID=A0AAE9XVA0_9PROT|nr:PAS domain-containing protein [Gimibacter soli]WCL53499.1 PAS domain-containing protein [Gimibacter soli]